MSFLYSCHANQWVFSYLFICQSQNSRSHQKQFLNIYSALESKAEFSLDRIAGELTVLILKLPVNCDVHCIGSTMYSNGGVCVCFGGKIHKAFVRHPILHNTPLLVFLYSSQLIFGHNYMYSCGQEGSTMMGTDFWNNDYQRYKFLEESRAMLSQKMCWILTLMSPFQGFRVILNDRTYFLKYRYIPDNNVIYKKINLFSIWK